MIDERKIRLIASREPTYMEMEDLVRALDNELAVTSEMSKTINRMRDLIISLRAELAKGVTDDLR